MNEAVALPGSKFRVGQAVRCHVGDALGRVFLVSEVDRRAYSCRPCDGREDTAIFLESDLSDATEDFRKGDRVLIREVDSYSNKMFVGCTAEIKMLSTGLPKLAYLGLDGLALFTHRLRHVGHEAPLSPAPLSPDTYTYRPIYSFGPPFSGGIGLPSPEPKPEPKPSQVETTLQMFDRHLQRANERNLDLQQRSDRLLAINASLRSKNETLKRSGERVRRDFEDKCVAIERLNRSRLELRNYAAHLDQVHALERLAHEFTVAQRDDYKRLYEERRGPALRLAEFGGSVIGRCGGIVRRAVVGSVKAPVAAALTTWGAVKRAALATGGYLKRDWQETSMSGPVIVALFSFVMLVAAASFHDDSLSELRQDHLVVPTAPSPTDPREKALLELRGQRNQQRAALDRVSGILEVGSK